MKIIYLHQYFKTPEEGGPIRSYYLAKGLVDYGIEVEMITAHNKPSKVIKEVDGICVHYLPVHYDNSFSFQQRVISFLKFMYMAIDEAAAIIGADLCFATSTPLTIGLAAIKIKEKFSIPYHFEVRDLWPEAPIQMGAISNPWLLRYTRDMEQRIYDQAEKIIALSPGIHDNIVKKVSNKKVALIPNMSDVNFFEPQKKNPYLEDVFRTNNKFVVSYFGAIGKANHLEYLLEAARVSLDRQLPVKFLVVGDGAEKNRLEKLGHHRKLVNVEFLPFMNKKELRELLNVTDAAYISFANKPILETNSPNKFFDALASGKLVVTNTKGWIRELAEVNQCGFYTDPEKPPDFVEKISPFIKDKTRLNYFQQNARKLGETQFSRQKQVSELINVLTGIPNI